jgi:hypothetical protein
MNYGFISGKNLRPTEVLANIRLARQLLDPKMMPFANIVINVSPWILHHVYLFFVECSHNAGCDCG